MRSANDYLNMYKRLIDSENSDYWVTAEDFKKAINEARKEAINECAKKAMFTRVKVNKEAILSLINELR